MLNFYTISRCFFPHCYRCCCHIFHHIGVDIACNRCHSSCAHIENGIEQYFFGGKIAGYSSCTAFQCEYECSNFDCISNVSKISAYAIGDNRNLSYDKRKSLSNQTMPEEALCSERKPQNGENGAGSFHPNKYFVIVSVVRSAGAQCHGIESTVGSIPSKGPARSQSTKNGYQFIRLNDGPPETGEMD